MPLSPLVKDLPVSVSAFPSVCPGSSCTGSLRSERLLPISWAQHSGNGSLMPSQGGGKRNHNLGGIQKSGERYQVSVKHNKVRSRICIALQLNGFFPGHPAVATKCQQHFCSPCNQSNLFKMQIWMPPTLKENILNAFSLLLWYGPNS